MLLENTLTCHLLASANVDFAAVALVRAKVRDKGSGVASLDVANTTSSSTYGPIRDPSMSMTRLSNCAGSSLLIKDLMQNSLLSEAIYISRSLGLEALSSSSTHTCLMMSI